MIAFPLRVPISTESVVKSFVFRCLFKLTPYPFFGLAGRSDPASSELICAVELA